MYFYCKDLQLFYIEYQYLSTHKHLDNEVSIILLNIWAYAAAHDTLLCCFMKQLHF